MQSDDKWQHKELDELAGEQIALTQRGRITKKNIRPRMNTDGRKLKNDSGDGTKQPPRGGSSAIFSHLRLSVFICGFSINEY